MSRVSRARRLRRDSTDAERVLWRLLRNRLLAGWKFRSQAPIGRYIVNFVSLEGRVVVELDGSQHMGQAEYDEERTRWLTGEGFRVMRFWNNEVLLQTELVQESILLARLGTHARRHAPCQIHPHPALSHRGRGDFVALHLELKTGNSR